MIYLFAYIVACGIYLSLINKRIKNIMIYLFDVYFKTKQITHDLIERCLAQPIKKTDVKNARQNSILFVEVFLFFFGGVICVYLMYTAVKGGILYVVEKIKK